MYISDIAHHIQ